MCEFLTEERDSMEVPTHLNQTLSSLDVSKMDCNNNIKELLADIQILSRIIKYTVKEVAHLSVEEVAYCLRGADIEVGSTPVDPGLTNVGKVLSENTEDTILNEGYIMFDVRVTFHYREQDIRLIINVEAQKKSKPSDLEYHIESRMVYYLSRLISSQKNVEFFHDDYDNIKKVYSIWICTDASSDEDSICEYSLTPDITFGKAETSGYADKMKGIIIRIRKGTEVKESKNKLIVMLEDLLRHEEREQKKALLVEKHGLQMTVELNRRIDSMCNLADDFIEEGIAQGIAQGIEQTRLDIIWKKQAKGKSIEEIADALELSVAEVEALIQKNPHNV